jgi:Flp pilus assembly protein TadD
MNQKISVYDLEDLLILTGESKELLLLLAETCYNKNLFSRAVNYYFKLLSYEPDNPRFWNKIAVSFLQLKKIEQAIEISKIAYRLIDREMNEK